MIDRKKILDESNQISFGRFPRFRRRAALLSGLMDRPSTGATKRNKNEPDDDEEAEFEF